MGTLLLLAETPGFFGALIPLTGLTRPDRSHAVLPPCSPPRTWLSAAWDADAI